jgi:hypothetical protein
MLLPAVAAETIQHAAVAAECKRNRNNNSNKNPNRNRNHRNYNDKIPSKWHPALLEKCLWPPVSN